MTNRVGILREEKRLKEVLKFVDEQLSNEEFYNKKEKEPNEFLDMLYTARLIINAAIIRKESRGTHQRCDYPNTDDENWKKHIIQKGMRFILNQLDKQDYLKIIRDAIKEDLDGYGDITSKCIFDESHSSSGFIVCKRERWSYTLWN